MLNAPGHPSYLFFTHSDCSLPLITIFMHHHARQQCVPYCVIFNIIQDGEALIACW